MISFNKQVFLANIFLFSSATVFLRGEASSLRRHLKSERKGKKCQDIPARFRSDGNPVNFTSLYSAVFAKGNTTGLVVDTLCDSYINAYAATTNCSAFAGSYRKVGSCAVITEATGPEKSYLLKLEYFTNVLEGTTLYTNVAEAEGECMCNCPKGVIPGILADNSCTCVCEPQEVDCMCDSPFVVDFVSDLNGKMASSEYKIVDARQLVLLDLEICDSATSSYNKNFVCPGSETEAFAFLDTEFPSAFPTVAPSFRPTETPTESPTGKSSCGYDLGLYVWFGRTVVALLTSIPTYLLSRATI